MSTGTGYRAGQIDGQLGRPAAPQGSMPYAVHQNYLAGHANGSKK